MGRSNALWFIGVTIVCAAAIWQGVTLIRMVPETAEPITQAPGMVVIAIAIAVLIREAVHWLDSDELKNHHSSRNVHKIRVGGSGSSDM